MTTEGIGEDDEASHLWFVISMLPYCSIQSFPTMMLCTQQVGFFHVYASLCLENKKKTKAQKNKWEVLLCLKKKSAFASNAITQDNTSDCWRWLNSKTVKTLLVLITSLLHLCTFMSKFILNLQTVKFTFLGLSSSVSFSACVDLCNYYYNHNIEQFHHTIHKFAHAAPLWSYPPPILVPKQLICSPLQ